MFLWKPWQSSDEQHLFEIEIFCNIIHVFTVTFNQLNASLLNKSINFLFFLTPNSSWAANQNDFWRSCDTEDWSNDAENSALRHRNKLQIKNILK